MNEGKFNFPNNLGNNSTSREEKIKKLSVEVRDELFRNGALLPDGKENSTYEMKKAELDKLVQEQREIDEHSRKNTVSE